jgi:SpoVK/Ycf46/Vps4 family AAA+-type ATPase
LSLDAGELERRVSHIIQIASRWKALLLFDEADVFVAKRSLQSLERNRLVAIFLRKLEYFEGIQFLTTNQVGDFDAAVLNRMHLILKYRELTVNARRTIIVHFLKRVRTDQGPSNLSEEDLDRLAQAPLNGRQVSVYVSYERHLLTDHLFQIKNTIATAIALAVTNETRLSFSHISQALKANGTWISNSSGESVDDGLYD